MKHAVLQRRRCSEQGTLGVLAAGTMRLPVMEPPWRDNRRNRSCIPRGIYEVTPYLSPRFGRCLLVLGVPDRSHILVHAGNVGGDVSLGYHTHTLGCLLPGLWRGRLWVRGRRQEAVLNSRTALRHLLEWARQPLVLEVRDD